MHDMAGRLTPHAWQGWPIDTTCMTGLADWHHMHDRAGRLTPHAWQGWPIDTTCMTWLYWRHVPRKAGLTSHTTRLVWLHMHDQDWITSHALQGGLMSHAWRSWIDVACMTRLDWFHMQDKAGLMSHAWQGWTDVTCMTRMDWHHMHDKAGLTLYAWQTSDVILIWQDKSLVWDGIIKM